MDREKINEIVRKLIQADEAYYNTGHSIMEDSEYDSLRAFVKQYEPDHPYFDRVGNKPSSLWEKATHEIPMGSLEKVHTEEDFLKWAGKFGVDEVFISQPKVDGLSLEQRFDQGQYVQAITRGDGLVGEDITPNVALMSGFRTPELNITEVMHPELDLKGPYSTRCEVVLPKKDLDRINSTIPDKKDQYKNCRNASSGISRRLDGKFCKYLSLKYYDILLSKPLNENEKMEVLKGLLLPTVPYYVGNAGHMVQLYKKLKEARDSLPYGIDGMVIKINSWKKQQELGVVKGRPKGQIAWKFDPPSAATILLNVTWEVGRTGVITPLGHVEPVEIDGSVIAKVTLHNIAEIARLRIGIGDTVMLVKRGDIIPKIESVLEHKNILIEIPTHCPACKTELVNDGIRLMCPSVGYCVGKNFQRILNFIHVVKIDTFGESLAEKLYEQGKLTNLADIFALKKEDISSIEGWGDKSAETIITNINGLRKMDPAIFLSALGIPSLSTSTAEDLWNKYGAIDAIRRASVEDICTIKGYSTISATKIVEGLRSFDDQMMKILAHVELLDTSKGGEFSGKAFCFTGEMSHPRSYFQGLVTKMGGKNDSTVTKATTFLVCNENKGSSKSRKAEQYGVKIINEAQFLEMVGEVPETEKKPKLVTKSLFEDTESLPCPMCEKVTCVCKSMGTP